MKNKSKNKKQTAIKKTAINRPKKAVSESFGANDTKKQKADSVKDTRIKIIGVGGGGGSIINGLADKLNRVVFYALNTDLQALSKLKSKIKKVPFGQELTRGLGTGRNSELGQLAAVTDKDKWKKTITGDGRGDLYIIVSCLGGGVGSGATPIIAKTIKESGGIVYGIFTLPFQFEGDKKTVMAQLAIEKTRPYLNAYTIIPNEAIYGIVNRDAPLNQALQAINDNLGQSLFGLLETIYEPGAINIDFADLRAIFEGHGRLAYLNTISVEGTDRGVKAVSGILSNSFYTYGVRGAKGVIYNIKGQKLTLEEINLISKAINESVSKDAKIIFGVSRHYPPQEDIKVTILATGCGTKLFPQKNDNQLSEKPKVKKKLRKKKMPTEETKPAQKESVEKTDKVNKKIKKNAKKSGVKAKKSEKSELKEPKVLNNNPDNGLTGVASEEETVVVSDNSQRATPINIKIRRNANQIKQATEEIEEKMLNEEKKWEIPAFMRKSLNDNRSQVS